MNNAFRKAIVLGSQHGKVKRLSGFRKGHHAPDGHFDAANDFIRRIGTDEVEVLSKQIYTALKSTFSYKRKEMEYVCETGVSAIKTPDFDVNVSVSQDSEDVTGYSLETEVTSFRTPEIVFDPRFSSVLNSFCSQLIVEFEKPISLEDKIDLIEANDTVEPYLEYEPDCSSLTLRIPEPSIQFHVTTLQMVITLPNTRDLRQLIDHSAAAFEAFASAGIDLLEV